MSRYLPGRKAALLSQLLQPLNQFVADLAHQKEEFEVTL